MYHAGLLRTEEFIDEVLDLFDTETESGISLYARIDERRVREKLRKIFEVYLNENCSR